MRMLSTHFSEDELKCKDCGNCYVTPGLLSGLEAIRVLAGTPVTILCAYRCPTHNAAVGGQQKSMHISGKAADITIGSLSVKDMYNLADQVPEFKNGGIGIYPERKFIHVDDRGTRARWAQVRDKSKKNWVYVSFEEGWKYV